jgi:hypothetical protein
MMRRALMVVVAAGALAAPAAAKDLAKDLPGSWVVDKAAAFEAAAPPVYKMATPEKQKEMRDDMMKSMPDLVVTFTATTASMKAGTEAPQVAGYKVTKQDPRTLWVDLTPQVKSGPAPSAMQYWLEFVDANTVKMQKVGDPAPLVLKRSK